MSGWHELPNVIMALVYVVMSVVMLVGLYELVACYEAPLRPAWETARRQPGAKGAASQN